MKQVALEWYTSSCRNCPGQRLSASWAVVTAAAAGLGAEALGRASLWLTQAEGASRQPARPQSYEQKEAWPCQGQVCTNPGFPREGASPHLPALAMIIFILPVTRQPGGPVIWEPGRRCPVIPRRQASGWPLRLALW